MPKVKINGMSCGHCVESTKKALEAIPGVTDVHVDLEKKEAVYTGDVDEQLVKAAIEKIGFSVESV